MNPELAAWLAEEHDELVTAVQPICQFSFPAVEGIAFPPAEECSVPTATVPEAVPVQIRIDEKNADYLRRRIALRQAVRDVRLSQ